MPAHRTLTLILVLILLAACTPLPAAPIMTPTPTPIPGTSTPEIPEPSVPHGLRPENAATQVLESGTWVVRNSAGDVTATWNSETEAWEYSAENIDVEYTQIGLIVDQALIEPFLGPLPPDDPSTHFVNPETGERVGYGIGPNISINTTSGRSFTGTEVFVRFRGISSMIPGEQYFRALVLEIPRSEDRSDIFIVRIIIDSFTLRASLNDSFIYDQYTAETYGITRNQMIPLANEQLVGQMIMMIITPQSENPEIHQISRNIFDYLSGASSQIPRFTVSENSQAIQPMFMVPQSQYLIP